MYELILVRFRHRVGVFAYLTSLLHHQVPALPCAQVRVWELGPGEGGHPEKRQVNLETIDEYLSLIHI